jgi:hypothetical protein
MGTTVMVMQVSCKAPGCVPLETAIIIVFPNSTTELVPGLPESQNGGSYKTKILKPMADVTNDDILDALPPAFKGGRRTMERLCLYARDVMLAQVTQLFGQDEESSVKDRRAMAEYLQSCLQDYMKNDCRAPEEGEPFPESNQKEESGKASSSEKATENETSAIGISGAAAFPAKGNLIIQRVIEEPAKAKEETSITSTNKSGTGILSGRGPTKHQKAIQTALNPTSSSNISKLFEREHAPGIRQAGCPCCDPENPSNLVDTMMML